MAVDIFFGLFQIYFFGLMGNIIYLSLVPRNTLNNTKIYDLPHVCGLRVGLICANIMYGLVLVTINMSFVPAFIVWPKRLCLICHLYHEVCCVMPAFV